MTGTHNTATGVDALFSNTTGTQNTATGSSALVNLAAGSSNIAIGSNAGRALLSGDNNIDIGNEVFATNPARSASVHRERRRKRLLPALVTQQSEVWRFG
jgi:hypothetical protein